MTSVMVAQTFLKKGLLNWFITEVAQQSTSRSYGAQNGQRISSCARLDIRKSEDVKKTRQMHSKEGTRRG